MVNKELLDKLFSGFSIQRWNDYVRPIDLNELDRTGLKMMIAFFLGKYEEKEGHIIDWNFIIKGGFFELLKKIVLSDLKLTVHRRIKQDPEAFKELNNWVISKYEERGLLSKKLLDEFKEYLLINHKENLSYQILRAGHKYSTFLEFQIIKPLNQAEIRLDDAEEKVRKDLYNYLNLVGLRKIIMKQDLYKLIVLIGRLRYQQRWSQTPRIPRTSVLGHSMFVASLTLLWTLEINGCNKRLYNNFFCGLFHDLPEAVTRDIVRPVKDAIEENFPQLVKDIEKEIVEKDLFPLLDDNFKNDIILFTQDEFSNKFIDNDNLIDFEKEVIPNEKNEDIYNPIDGALVKYADELAAFIEAAKSIEFGIRTKELLEVRKLKDIRDNTKYMGIDIGVLYRGYPI